MKQEYLSVVYATDRTPKTAYPLQLAAYLMKRFRLDSRGSILEVGSGRGDFINAFQALGMNASAIDREESAATNPDVQFKKVNLETEPIPFPDNSFDVVYHKSVLEHFFKPDHIMSESLRVLKPGGKLVFLVPDWESQYKTFYEDVTHCRPYTVNAIRDLLAMNGLKDSGAEKFYQLPAVWSFPILKVVNRVLRIFIPTIMARKLTSLTGIKYFRWSVELMILGYGTKPQ
jgi:SAM-dependent methyltransferase